MPDACAGIEHADRSYRPQGTPVVSESVPYEHPLPYASGSDIICGLGSASGVALWLCPVFRSLTVAISYHKIQKKYRV